LNYSNKEFEVATVRRVLFLFLFSENLQVGGAAVVVVVLVAIDAGPTIAAAAADDDDGVQSSAKSWVQSLENH
jgi:hypothetical protein